MGKNTWTDEEMKCLLKELGYDLTNDRGEFSSYIMSDISVNSEGYKWDDENELWYK